MHAHPGAIRQSVVDNGHLDEMPPMRQLGLIYVANKPLGDGQGQDAVFGPRS